MTRRERLIEFCKIASHFTVLGYLLEAYRLTRGFLATGVHQDSVWGKNCDAISVGQLRDIEAFVDFFLAEDDKPSPTTSDDNPAPIPMLLWCPQCRAQHVDTGEFTTRAHHTHACQTCGLVWRPALVSTVGVQFLPGFKQD